MLIWLSVFSLFFVILALTHLDWALLIIITTLPSYLIRFHVWGLPSTLLELMILISFGVWFFKFFLPNLTNLLKNKKTKHNYPFHWELILLLIISSMAVAVAGFSFSALGIWKAYFLEPLLLFILIFNVFKTKKDLFQILWALLFSAIAVSLFALFQQITGLFISNPFWANISNRRVVSFFGYPNAVGLYLAPLILLFTGWLFSLSWKNLYSHLFSKLLIISTIIISLLSIYFARSEGALIGIVAGLLVFSLLVSKKHLLVISFLLLTVIGGMFWFAPNNDFIAKKLTLHDLSGQIRLQEWKETITMLKHGKLITGAGLDNYQTAIRPYHQAGIFFNFNNLPNFNSRLYGSASLRAKYWQPVEIYMYPHNIILNFWTELGLAGVLLFMWLIGKYLLISFKLSLALKKENKQERYLILGLLTAMISIVIHGLVDVPYFKNDLSLMFWIFFALLGFLNLDYQSRKKLKINQNTNHNQENSI